MGQQEQLTALMCRHCSCSPRDAEVAGWQLYFQLGEDFRCPQTSGRHRWTEGSSHVGLREARYTCDGEGLLVKLTALFVC